MFSRLSFVSFISGKVSSGVSYRVFYKQIFQPVLTSADAYLLL